MDGNNWLFKESKKKRKNRSETLYSLYLAHFYRILGNSMNNFPSRELILLGIKEANENEVYMNGISYKLAAIKVMLDCAKEKFSTDEYEFILANTVADCLRFCTSFAMLAFEKCLGDDLFNEDVLSSKFTRGLLLVVLLVVVVLVGFQFSCCHIFSSHRLLGLLPPLAVE